MNFEKGYIYHIYNQGNNRQKIFFNKENYLFFLNKIKNHILPYADILAWCLMPNHFHLMVLVNEIEVEDWMGSGSVASSRTPTKININKSIGIMLASYTRAINKQNNAIGSLFRNKTKAECINCPKGITPSWFKNNGITQINITDPEKQYPQMCFNYIHENPVKAGLVERVKDWEFSSAKDYAGLRDGKLINREVTMQYVEIGSR